MTTVLKVGGASVRSIAVPDEQTVVVHGAGPQISQEMQQRGLQPQFVGGRRDSRRGDHDDRHAVEGVAGPR